MKEKLNEIIDGWKHVIMNDPFVEKIAKKRAAICAGCSEATKTAGVLKCAACGCPLIAKTRSMDSKCPKDKWDDE
jgi:ribosomal protein L37E|tara:strand:- start:414 stop:638 length:225 start_codon:yes stop_codon:yes gene_type:complete